ncbi:universal stress protein [Pseudothauera nasutitermitis]|uniref:Universal stress protein n=1 Tax=Pseudothauera nasutitermitis TaxID=2565930 RepID=A0A4S4ARD9_9RHOO|nr:universal stress protein [Pseudothauera nasutitermitis]THF62393.1 universal stress protein [Pseudothauera nasutitermitis]
MYKHILVAIDDSQTSRKALQEAISLARLHNAELEIAHAVDESVLETFSTHGVALADAKKIQGALLDSGQSTLDEAVHAAEEAGLKPKRRLLSSGDLHAADQIAKAVVDSGADLLVVGSHGRRGFQRLLLGSVAENLVRKVAVSVLIVRSPH